MTYGVTAATAGKYTLYISFANGGSSARGYSVSAGDKTLIADGSMESTGGWTTWKTQSVEIELDKGYSELKFESLSKDGMANIDYIGWSTTPGDTTEFIGKRDMTRSTVGSPADRYYVDFGSRGVRAGVYLMRNGKTFRVNGATK